MRRPPSLPRHAKRVFHGTIFDVYQWKQKLFDGTYATFEKASRADSVAIVPVTEEGKILMTREKQPDKPPFIGVPGGVVDAHETPRAAVRRELLEETGYSAARIVPWFSYAASSRIAYTIHLFIARGCVKVRPQHLDAGERIAVRETSFSAFVRTMAMDKKVRNKEVALRALRALADRNEMRAFRRKILG